MNIRKLLLFIIISFFIPVIIGGFNVYAISQTNLNSIYGDSIYYEPNQTCATSQNILNAGTGAPNGAQFPNLNPTDMANAINAWINQENPKSELSGLGSTIVADGQHSNINPFLIVSIAKEESSLADPSDFNVQHANNSFGREASPGQPSFQGSHLWYKWSSVKASVDYTAPENQNVAGGGDIASYLKDQYSSQITQQNITALMEAYAPPSQNNTAQYVANINLWTNQLIDLTLNGSSATSTSNNSNVSSSSACGGGMLCNQNNTSNNNTSNVRQQVVCIAQQELSLWQSQPGYTPLGGPGFIYAATGYLKYSQNSQEEWCADFASWVYNQAGYPIQPDPNWRVAAVQMIQSIGEKNQNFHWHPEPGYTPKPGDLAIHLYGSTYAQSHVNIVVGVSGNNVTMIGGDQGPGLPPSPGTPGQTVVSEYTVNSFTGDSIIGYVSPD